MLDQRKDQCEFLNAARQETCAARDQLANSLQFKQIYIDYVKNYISGKIDANC